MGQYLQVGGKLEKSVTFKIIFIKVREGKVMGLFLPTDVLMIFTLW